MLCTGLLRCRYEAIALFFLFFFCWKIQLRAIIRRYNNVGIIIMERNDIAAGGGL